MKNQLFKILIKALVFILTIAILPIAAMEEPIDNLEMKVLNNSKAEISLRAQDNTLLGTIKEGQLKTFDLFTSQWETVKMEWSPKNISIYDRLPLNVYADNERYAIIQIIIHKQPEVLLEANIAELEQEPKRYFFNIDRKQISLPITINSNLRIHVGLSEGYHSVPSPINLKNVKPITIKGQEFQIPQEFINVRAPQLKQLIDQPK